MIKLETITIALPAACGPEASLQVDLSRMAPHILESLIAHGVKQKVADSCSGAEKKKADDWTVADFNEACAKVVEALYAGTWATKGGGARITSLAAYVTSEANKAAKLRIAKDSKATPMPAYLTKGLAPTVIQEHVAKHLAKDPGLNARWAEEWNARQAAKADTIDLGDLFGDDAPKALKDLTRTELENLAKVAGIEHMGLTDIELVQAMMDHEA